MASYSLAGHKRDFIYLLHSGLAELPSNIAVVWYTVFSWTKEKQVAHLCDGPGDSFHFAPIQPSQLRVWALLGESRKAELSSFQREFAPPPHSPWWFDCSTWHTPSSGHSGLVGHGCKHIPLGRALVPAQTKQAISTVTFPFALCAYLWAGEVHWGAKVNSTQLWQAQDEPRHTVASSCSQESPSLSQAAAL